MEPQQPQSQSKPKLMDASTQYFDKGIMLTPRYPDPPQGKVDSSCQYSPTDIGYLYPSPSVGSYRDTTGDSGLYGFSNSSSHMNPMGYAGLYGLSPSGHCNATGKGYPYGLASTSGDGHSAVNSGAYRLSGSVSSEHNGISGGAQLSSEHNGMLGGGQLSNERNGLPGRGQLRGEHSDSVLGGGQVRGEHSMSVGGQFRGDHNMSGGGQPRDERNGMSGEGQPRDERNGMSGGGQVKSERTSTASGTQQPKPYQCPECNASFTRVDHLSRHLKTQRSHFHNAMVGDLVCGSFFFLGGGAGI